MATHRTALTFLSLTLLAACSSVAPAIPRGATSTQGAGDATAVTADQPPVLDGPAAAADASTADELPLNEEPVGADVVDLDSYTLPTGESLADPVAAPPLRPIDGDVARRLVTATAGQSRFWSVAGSYDGAYEIEPNALPAITGKIFQNSANTAWAQSIRFVRDLVTDDLGIDPDTPVPVPTEDLEVVVDEDQNTAQEEYTIAVAGERFTLPTTSAEPYAYLWYWTAGIEKNRFRRDEPWPIGYYEQKYITDMYRPVRTSNYTPVSTIGAPNPWLLNPPAMSIIAPTIPTVAADTNADRLFIHDFRNRYSTVRYKSNPYVLNDQTSLTAHSNFTYSTNAVGRAIDDSRDSYWRSYNGATMDPPPSLVLDQGAVGPFLGLSYKGYSNAGGPPVPTAANNLGSHSIEVSDDMIEWRTVRNAAGTLMELEPDDSFPTSPAAAYNSSPPIIKTFAAGTRGRYLRLAYHTPTALKSFYVYHAKPIAGGVVEGTGDYEFLLPAFNSGKFPLTKVTNPTLPGAATDAQKASCVGKFEAVGRQECLFNFHPQWATALNARGATTGYKGDDLWANRYVYSGYYKYAFRRARPFLRATPGQLLDAIDNGKITLPPHLPERKLINLQTQGEGKDDGAFTRLGNGRVSYVVPANRVLVLNHFRNAILVNGIRIEPAGPDVHVGGNFIFGSGEEVTFTLTGTDQISGITVDPQLVTGLGDLGGPK